MSLPCHFVAPYRPTNCLLASLSPARQQLIRLMQRVWFGRIEQLQIRDGDPVLDPIPRVVRQYKFASTDESDRHHGNRNFSIKESVVDLLQLLDLINDGVIDELTIKHGLPFGSEYLHRI